MNVRPLLWLFLLVLVGFWFGALIENGFRGPRIAISADTLFLAFTLCVCTCAIALVLLSRPRGGNIAADYVAFVEALAEEGPLPKERLEELTGETKREKLGDDGSYKKVAMFVESQHLSLAQLVYEEKIHLRDGKYSLPG